MDRGNGFWPSRKLPVPHLPPHAFIQSLRVAGDDPSSICRANDDRFFETIPVAVNSIADHGVVDDDEAAPPVDRHAIAGMLGHSVARTSELYAHHHPDHLKNARASLEQKRATRPIS